MNFTPAEVERETKAILGTSLGPGLDRFAQKLGEWTIGSAGLYLPPSMVERAVESRLIEKASLLDWNGADPTGVNDSDVAFEGALEWLNAQPNGAVLDIPAGVYNFSGHGYLVRRQFAHIQGAGRGATRLRPAVTDRNFLVFQNQNPTGFLQGTSLRGVSIINRADDPTSNALLLLDRLSYSLFFDVYLNGGYFGVRQLSCLHTNMSAFDIIGGNNFTSRKAGSALCRIDKSPDADSPGSENIIGAFDWRGMTNFEYLDFGLSVGACDGLTLGGDNHIGFCGIAAVYLQPSGSEQLTGVAGGIYVDSVPTGAGLLTEAGPDPEVRFGNHNIHFVNTWNLNRVVDWNCPATTESHLHIPRGIAKEFGVRVQADAKLRISRARISDLDPGGIAVRLGPGAANVSIERLVTTKGRAENNISVGLSVNTGVTGWEVLSADFNDCDTDWSVPAGGEANIHSVLTNKGGKRASVAGVSAGYFGRNIATMVGALTGEVPAIGVDATSVDENVSVALGTPKGTGAISAQVPTASTVGGNVRGANAVDWQMLRAQAGQVASGIASVVSGGSGNAATGDYSWVPGGQAATTRGYYGRGAWAATQFAALGDQQGGEWMLGRITTNNSATRLTANNLAPGSINTLNLPNNGTYRVKLLVLARQTAGTGTGDSAAWEADVLVSRGANAAATTYVGGTYVTSAPALAALASATNVAPSLAGGGATAWRIQVSADTTNGGIAITVTGESSKTIQWSARALSVESVG